MSCKMQSELGELSWSFQIKASISKAKQTDCDTLNVSACLLGTHCFIIYSLFLMTQMAQNEQNEQSLNVNSENVFQTSEPQLQWNSRDKHWIHSYCALYCDHLCQRSIQMEPEDNNNKKNDLNVFEGTVSPLTLNPVEVCIRINFFFFPVLHFSAGIFAPWIIQYQKTYANVKWQSQFYTFSQISASSVLL